MRVSASAVQSEGGQRCFAIDSALSRRVTCVLAAGPEHDDNRRAAEARYGKQVSARGPGPLARCELEVKAKPRAAGTVRTSHARQST
eukprot:1557693-Rhodomonas_salina.2